MENYAWTHQEVCKDKSDGPSLHIASFSVEWGNGKITKDPSRANPPPPIHIKEMLKYIQDTRQHNNPCLPVTADVYMFLGKNKDGWWLGDSVAMQTELAMDIFEHVGVPASLSAYLHACLPASYSSPCRCLDQQPPPGSS